MDESKSIFRRRIFAAVLLFIMIFADEIAAETRVFEIETGNAKMTLREFARQARLSVVMDRSEVRHVQTNGVFGLLVPRDALERMLEGTPLVFKEDLETGAFAVTRSKVSIADLMMHDSEVQAPESEQKSQTTLDKMISPKPLKKKNLLRKAFGGMASFALAASLTFAQDGENGEDEIFELSPFTVDASKDVGYQGGNSRAGSRFNTSLKDTAAAITVFTDEFLDDFSVTSLDELIGYAPNMQEDINDATDNADTSFLGGSDRRGTRIRVRGLEASKAVDFFATEIPIDTYNTERIELSSGPNSILFGFGSPGGLVNTNTKRANPYKDRTSFRFQFAEYGHRRFEFDHNQVLVEDKLAIRLNALSQTADSWRRFNFNEKKRYAAALLFRPSEKSTFVVNYETGELNSSVDRNTNARDSLALYEASGAPTKSLSEYNAGADRPRGINRNTSTRSTYITDVNGTTPFVLRNGGNPRRFLESTYEDISVPSALRAGNTQLPESLLPYDINLSGGPGGFRELDLERYFASFEHRLTPNITLELAYNKEDTSAHVQAIRNNASALYRDPNTEIVSSDITSNVLVPNPNEGRYYLEAFWGADEGAINSEAMRASLAWDLKTERFGNHKIGAMVERTEREAFRYGGFEILVDDDGVAINRANAPGNRNNWLYRRQYVTLGDFESFVPSNPFETVTLESNGVTYHSDFAYTNINGGFTVQETDTVMVATQSRFFKERLNVTAGLRKDRITFNSFGNKIREDGDPVIAGSTVAGTPIFTDEIIRENDFDLNTGTLGAVFHVSQALSVFSNYANNNGQPRFNRRILPDLTLPPPTEGESIDGGFMLNLFDGKVFLRATAYLTTQDNDSNAINLGDIRGRTQRILETLNLNGLITQDEVDARSIEGSQLRGTSSSESTGYELSASFNLSKSFTGLLNFSYTSVERSNIAPEFEEWFNREMPFWLSDPNNGDLVEIEGTTTINDLVDTITEEVASVRRNALGSFGNRPLKISATGRYRLDGKLKGISVGGGVRWQEAAIIGREFLGVDDLNNSLFGDTFEGDDFFNVDAFISYKRKIEMGSKSANLTLQLNISNLTDEDNVRTLRFNRDRSGVARVRLSNPRTARMTVGLQF